MGVRGVRFVAVVAERAEAGLAVAVERLASLVSGVVFDLRRGEEEGVFGIRWEVGPAGDGRRWGCCALDG